MTAKPPSNPIQKQRWFNRLIRLALVLNIYYVFQATFKWVPAWADMAISALSVILIVISLIQYRRA